MPLLLSLLPLDDLIHALLWSLMPLVVADATVPIGFRYGRLRLYTIAVAITMLQLLQDLKTLRALLDYAFRYDAITFYELLLDEKKKAAAVREPPPWIGMPAAERWGCRGLLTSC